VSLTHQSAVAEIRDNLTLHIDEIEEALTMLEDSLIIDNIAELLSGDEEEEGGSEKEEEVEVEEDSAFNLSELRDGLIEIITEDMLDERSLTINAEGNELTYAVNPEHVCANDEEDEGERSPEEIEEQAREYQDCIRRLEANPVTIVARSIGERKINLYFTVADHPEALRIQIHDDLIAGFVPLSFVKRFIRVFVDESDLEMPDTMTGLIGLEARRIDSAHFALRMAILDDIDINSEASAAVRFQLASTTNAGSLTLNGPAQLIEGQLDLGTINLELPWQSIVDLFYDDEGETRTECFDNSADVNSCNEVLYNCPQSCNEDSNSTDCENTCLERAPGHVQGTLRSYLTCLDTVPETECGAEDSACRESRCRDNEAFREVCGHRSWCEEYQEEAEEAPEVEGNLKILMDALSGSLSFDMNGHTLSFHDMTLGNDSMSIIVEDTPIIEVNLNAENDRKVSMVLTAAENGDLSLQVSPVLDLSVALTLDNVWEAFVENQEDLPQVLANDTLGIKFDGSDTPTLELLNANDETEMRVSSGQLMLSSPRMSDAVIIGEGMCMSSEDEDALSEEERDSRHELFGLLMSVECRAE
jgi:hypothetical protein